MSDPQPDRLKPRPPRAAPLQPDRPGGGAGKHPPPAASADAELEQTAERQRREQADTALQNTRKGYG